MNISMKNVLTKSEIFGIKVRPKRSGYSQSKPCMTKRLRAEQMDINIGGEKKGNSVERSESSLFTPDFT